MAVTRWQCYFGFCSAGPSFKFSKISSFLLWSKRGASRRSSTRFNFLFTSNNKLMYILDIAHCLFPVSEWTSTFQTGAAHSYQFFFSIFIYVLCILYISFYFNLQFTGYILYSNNIYITITATCFDTFVPSSGSSKTVHSLQLHI